MCIRDRLYNKLVDTFGKDVKVPILKLREKNDPGLAEVADYGDENVFLHYTMKQWGQTPDEIDPSVTARVPVFVGDDDRYFPQAPFQGCLLYTSSRASPPRRSRTLAPRSCSPIPITSPCAPARTPWRSSGACTTS